MAGLVKSIVLATLALAIVAQDTGGCPGVQLLIAPCTVAQAGETITEDEALKSVSDIVAAGPLSLMNNETRGYISFTTAVFEMIPACQIPAEEACGFLPCSCDGRGQSGRKLQGVIPFWCPIRPPGRFKNPPSGPGRPKDPSDSKEGNQCLPLEPVEETVVAVCREDKCTGFLVQNQDIVAGRNQLCEEEVIESCVDPAAPACPACIPERCCNSERRSRLCVCGDCPGRTLRREKTETGIVTLRSSKGGNKFPECKCS